jgi:hypothetical protein
MANTLRTPFQGKDGRLNLDKGILTLYGKDKIERYNVKVTLDLPVVRAFLTKAYSDGKNPCYILRHITDKNKFTWSPTGLDRWDIWNDRFYSLSANTKHTEDVLLAMVRANVK